MPQDRSRVQSVRPACKPCARVLGAPEGPGGQLPAQVWFCPRVRVWHAAGSPRHTGARCRAAGAAQGTTLFAFSSRAAPCTLGPTDGSHGSGTGHLPGSGARQPPLLTLSWPDAVAPQCVQRGLGTQTRYLF